LPPFSSNASRADLLRPAGRDHNRPRRINITRPRSFGGTEAGEENDAMPIIKQPNRIVNEIERSHAVLDRCGVPRRLRGAGLTLPQRISFLHGRLTAARDAACFGAVMLKQIFVLGRDEWKSCIPPEYQVLEVKP